MRKISTKSDNCLEKNRRESGGYQGVQTYIGITESNLMEVQQTKDGLLERILSPGNLNRAYKQVLSNKGSGGVDRLIQQSISQVLSPIYEREFSEQSYGFRPHLSCHDALRSAQSHVNAGYKYVVDLDLEKFFDTVSHSRLIELLSKGIKDGRVVSANPQIFNAGITGGFAFGRAPFRRSSGFPS